MGLARTTFVHRNVLLIALLTNFCSANKIHFSKWIKTGSVYPKNIYIFETILGKGLDYCIESCKAKVMCKYVNFKVNADMCSLIGEEETISDGVNNLLDDKTEKRRGYIFGRKQDWDLGEYEVCKSCRLLGECKSEADFTDILNKCQNSGCGPPKEKEFATVHGNMFVIGDKAMYQCQTGYKNAFDNTGIVTCQSSGLWSNIDFKCVKDDWICNRKSCFYVEQTMRTWNRGKDFCDGIGGFLADIESIEEFLFIRQNISIIYPHAMWLGGNDLQVEGSWTWLDGTPFGGQYDNWWQTGEPNSQREENCMIFWTDKRFHDNNCDSEQMCLCEINI